ALFRSILSIEVSKINNSVSLEYVNENGETEEVEVGGDGGSTRTNSYPAVDVGGSDAEIMSGSGSATPSGGAGGGSSANASGNGNSESGEKRKEENRFSGDRYCGNCAFYDYVHEQGGDSVPYCRHHSEILDDLEACEEYEVRTGETKYIETQ
ncbi:MAG: hypothetical protein SXQ77_01270, partial [Halobacteria archaeon]|nr:hypothetical protein [Halobacteria archaeon]